MSADRNRACRECGTPLLADADPRRRYCNTRCRSRHNGRGRDFTSPERRAADARRHRDRYARDADRPIRPYHRKDQP